VSLSKESLQGHYTKVTESRKCGLKPTVSVVRKILIREVTDSRLQQPSN